MTQNTPNTYYPLPTTSPTPSTKVILVRHARTTYNEQGRYQGSSDESVLTAKGHQDAYATGLALKEYNFDAIYTSPLKRVRQTTEAIIAALDTNNNLPPVLIDYLLTEIYMSNWQGLSYQEVKEKFQEDYHFWQHTPHLFSFNNNFYPVLELFDRAKKFWDKILTKHQGETILVVAHGGTNRALISTAIALQPKNYHSLQQSNCGISCLEFTSINNGELKYLNATHHLGETLPKLKAGKTGWRWLLLSNNLEQKILQSSYIRELIEKNLIHLVLTDGSLQSELLTLNLLRNKTQVIYLPIARGQFLETWQQTIFTRQKINNLSREGSLVTVLIIVQEKFIAQILQKTLENNINLDTANCLSVIHYPQVNRQSILQGLLPINRQLVTQSIYSNSNVSIA